MNNGKNWLSQRRDDEPQRKRPRKYGRTRNKILETEKGRI